MNIFIKKVLSFCLCRFNSDTANTNLCTRLSKSSRLYSIVKRSTTFFIAAIAISSLSACTLVVGDGSDDVVASSLGASPETTSPETTSPDAGSITVVPLSDDSVKISWSSSSEALSYQVHDSNGLVATIQHPATSYTAEGLLPNTEYTYRIRVCDSSGCSDWTSESIKISLPQAISNANELAAIGLDSASLAGDYTLTDNINLSSIPNWLPIGNLTDAFTGTFNGNGYNISRISISDYKHAGLFGYVKDAHISNLVVLVDSIKALAYSRGSSATAGGLAMLIIVRLSILM